MGIATKWRDRPGNTFIDVEQFMRYDSVDTSGGVMTNSHYFLDNTGENEPDLGEIIQFHMQGPVDPSKPSTVSNFALMMAGNNFGSTYVVFHTSAWTTQQGGLPKVSISRNTFISPKTIRWGGGNWSTFANNSTPMVGSFVNNRLVDDMRDPVTMSSPNWYDATNRIVTID
jgi:hypothetical protein